MSMKAAELFDLKGRVALVTGASGGLGLRFAEVLAENGAAVALVARRADRLKDAVAKIEKAGGKAIAVEADVLDRAQMNKAFDQVEKTLGTVTILVNNAGVAHSTRAGQRHCAGLVRHRHQPRVSVERGRQEAHPRYSGRPFRPGRRP
jgi:NADP-dependent 3-hydroxy acid dehydrogenase YdfG